MPESIADFERQAALCLSKSVYDYVAGGAGDESGLRASRRDLDSVRLVSQVLRGMDDVDTRASYLGTACPFPILIAPTAYQSMVHPGGETAIARAAKELGLIMMLSTLSTQEMEAVQQESRASLWFQLYFYRDREMTRQLVARAQAAGYRALVLTVDLPVLGIRYRDRRNGFRVPSTFQLVNLLPKEYRDQLAQEGGNALERFFDEQRNPALTWKDVEWLRSLTKMPIFLKGILGVEDAKIAAANGVAGIVVSDHGGRQLDALVSPAAALPAIRNAVGDSLLILADGGVRSGSDVIRYLCLGANGVLVGRPVVWGLAVGGSEGVRQVLTLITDEMRRAMMILGARNIAELGPGWIQGGSGSG